MLPAALLIGARVSLVAGALVTLFALSVLYHFGMVGLGARTMATMRRLDALRPPDPARWPRLSLIIPACNEAATLEAALRSRLDDGYPDLEIVLIDDRSTDGTGAIVDRIAAADPRVRALHVTALPEGWLGKLHAMQKGVEASTGEWLLFTDADVHVAPGALSRAVAHAEQHALDHLAVFPELLGGSFLADGAITTFTFSAGVAAPPWEVENPRSPKAVGVGAFNLVRRAALDRTPGLAWLKLETIDDIALAQMLKRQGGARASIVSGRGTVRVEWYGTLRAMALGTEKAAFAIAGNYQATRHYLACGLVALPAVLPLLALLPVGPAWLRPAALADIALVTGYAIALARWNGRRLGPALVWPLTSLLLVLMMARAAWVAERRGGVTWRGTLYPLAALRAGRRITLL